ncbi:MAG: DUF2079 domain-containing protein, partial [Deltaproteobacteria bacterium]|nr:DUF2079 domain-containing protein [Deltaproteobacteria bacterium]
ASKRRLTLMFVSSIAAMLCKEDVAIATGMIGLFTAWRFHRKAGLTLAIISGIWFVLCLKVFLPAFNEIGFFRFHNGGWFTGFYANMTDASWYLKTIFRPEIGRYLIHLLAPLAFLPLISPSVFALAVPAILINILSGTGYLHSIDYHYTTSITPFLMAAAIAGASRITRSSSPGFAPLSNRPRKGRDTLPDVPVPGQPHSSVALITLGVVLGATILSNINLSHIPLHRTADKILELATRSKENGQVQSLYEAIRLIPADAPVSADYFIVPHLTHREKMYMFPNPFENESWGIRGERPHDPNQIQFILVQDQILNDVKRGILSDLTDNRQFREVFYRSGVHLYRRVAPLRRQPVERPKKGNGLMGRFFEFQVPLMVLPDVRFRSAQFQARFTRIHFPLCRGEFVSIDGIRTDIKRRFLALFDGYIRIERSGEYEFIVKSDDGFRLLIGGTTIGEWNDLRALDTTRMRITLKKGLVPIQLYYFENEPPHGLHLLWRPPGHDREMDIEANILFPSREAAERETVPDKLL